MAADLGLANMENEIAKREERKPSKEEEEKDRFVLKLKQLLKKSDVDASKAFIRDKKHAPLVTKYIWDIIPLLTEYVTTKHMKSTPEMYEACIKMLKNVSKIADPEELVLAFLQELQKAEDDEMFLNLLKPLQTSIIRMTNKRPKFIGWALHAIYRYLTTKLPCPLNYNYEEEGEKLLIDADPTVDRITSVYYESLPFYDPFLFEFLKCRTRDQLEVKNLLIRYMVNCLDAPLAYLDLQERKGTHSRGKRIAAKLVENIVSLMPNVFTFLEFRTNKSGNNLVKDLALSVFYYFCLCENDKHNNKFMAKTPYLYNPLYLFNTGLNFCIAAFSIDSQFSIERGLCLAEFMINGVKNQNINHQTLNLQIHSRFCLTLTKIIINNPIKKCRMRALKIFNDYFKCFNTKGRYLICLYLGKISDNANFKAYVIGLYKEMWHEEINKHNQELPSHFRDYKLINLLKMYCKLPEQEDRDLIDLSDQIIACLNVLRYMVLRDAKENKSKIFDFIKSDLNPNYLEPLKKALVFSKLQCNASEQEVKGNVDGKSKKDKDEEETEVSMNVNGKCLADGMEISDEDKKKILQSTLTTFDVIDSILCCLNEDIAKGQLLLQQQHQQIEQEQGEEEDKPGQQLKQEDEEDNKEKN